VIGAPLNREALFICIAVPLLLTVALVVPPSRIGRYVAAAALLTAAAVDATASFRLSSIIIYDASVGARRKWDALNKAYNPDLQLHGLWRTTGAGTNNDNLITKQPELYNYSAMGNELHKAVRSCPRAEAMVIHGQRVWFAPTAPFAPPTQQTLETLRTQLNAGHAPSFVLHSRAAMLGRGTDPPLSPTSLPVAQAADVRLLRYDANQLLFDWLAPTDGWLFIGDRWTRGWTARVNDAPVEVDGANLVFRAIRVPAGSIRVDMTYRPHVRPLVAPSWVLLLLALVSAIWLPKTWRRWAA
jgi:hypothetical protein